MRKMWQEGGEAPFDDISDPQGDEIQKLSVIQTLPSLLADDQQTCIQRLMPKMQQTLPTASTEFHVAASSTFKTILEQGLVSHSTFTETFLQSILNSLDSRDQIVAHAWLETLLDVIELLPKEVIRLDILPTAVNKGQLSQPVHSRITCCKLIGKICTRFDSQLIKKDILPTVHSLCQDVDSNVRACICLQLQYVAEGLDPESIKSALLPSIVELASDENSSVRHASVQTIVHLLPHLQPDVIKSTISPLIKKSCDIALISDDTVMCIKIAQEFGKLAIGLEKCLTSSEKTWLIKHFQRLSQIGISSIKTENIKQEFPYTSSNSLMNEHYAECRRLCAFNIPAMFLFTSNTVEDMDILLSTFTHLTSDPFYMVRRTIACGIHEVAKIFGPKNTIIKNHFTKLLKDDHVEVLQGLIPHVARTLELLVQNHTIGTEQMDPSMMELGNALLKCEDEIFNTRNWRLSATIFEQLEILPKCFSSDYIYTYFVPVTVNRALNGRPMPVRLAAGRTFLIFTRYNLKPNQRTDLRNKLYEEFARNDNCYVRMIFIRMMIEAMSIYSSMYFKEHFFTTVLNLIEDPIANIRLKVVTLLPTLKSYLRLPSDKKLLSSFTSSIRNLMNNEKDRDVLFELTNTIRKVDEIDVRHESQTSSGKLSKQDLEDMRKYEEEKRLLTTMASKSFPSGQISSFKKSITHSRLAISDGASSKTKQNSSTIDRVSVKSSISSTTQKVKQVGVPMTITDNSLKASRQTTSASRNFDLSKASSMPEIPVTLLEDEFLVDTGVRIPAQLSTSQSTSKIPNLQDIIYRNTRIGNVNKSRRNSVNYDKGKTKGYYSMHESCTKSKLSSIDQTNQIKTSNRLSINSDDPKRYPVSTHGKLRMCFDSSVSSGKLVDDKLKRSTTIADKDKSLILQPRCVVDKTKRHSTNYSMKIPETKDIKQKFKRHSLEVTNYNPINRNSSGNNCSSSSSCSSNRLKRTFTLDVNHNQGTSKIPLRNTIASGSRTAPVTRASSPIKLEPQLNFDKDYDHNTTDDYCFDRHLGKFSSSDEKVDKFCLKLVYANQSCVRDENSRKNLSKLPVWMLKKKS